jgi:uncharacterized protein (TIGR02453 family)
MKSAHFGPELFKFLRDLKRHNDRAWFDRNRERYERDVKAPLLRFIVDFAEPLSRISPHMLADPRPMGGSMFRIYRDTRFSKDKSPYKTHAAAQFRHRAGKDVHAPGFYMHLEPGEVFVGAGIWHPDSPTLALIRRALVARGADWRKAVSSRAFKKECSLAGDVLARPPRGFAPEHPMIAEIKRKDFIAIAQWSERDALRPGFMDKLAGFCRTTAPMMRFLAKASKLEF